MGSGPLFAGIGDLKIRIVSQDRRNGLELCEGVTHEYRRSPLDTDARWCHLVGREVVEGSEWIGPVSYRLVKVYGNSFCPNQASAQRHVLGQSEQG